MHRRYIKLIAVFLLLSVVVPFFPGQAFAAEETPPEISEYIQVMYDDGLLSHEANTILHSKSGYIWIGSYSGLTRYDSTSFVTYGDDEDSLMNGVSVRALYEDTDGRVWIGSNEKGVYLYQSGEFSRIDTGIDTTGSIRSFAETAQGIYVASTGGIMLIDSAGEVHQIGVAGIDSSRIAGMFTDTYNRLWILDNDSVAVLNGREIVYNADMSSYTSEDCNCITQLNDGRIIIGTGGSDVIYIEESSREWIVSVKGLSDPKVKGDTADCQTINCILEDEFGRIWIGADSGLGYIYKDKYHVAVGVELTSIEHIERDYEGNFWLASSRYGVMQLARGRFNNKSQSSTLHGVTVNATQIYEGLLFAATDTGVQVCDPKTFERVSHPMSKLLEGIRVRGLFVDSKGYLWLTTYMEYGVVRYKDGEFVSISTKDGLASNKTRVCMELPNGDIAVSSGGGVSIIRDTEVIKTYTQEDGLENPVILSMCMDKAGNMYFGSDGNGIYIVSTGGDISRISSADGLPSDVILNMIYDKEIDAVWISTGSSIAYLDSEGIHNLDNFRTGSGSIFDIKFVDENVWILRNTSVIVGTRDTLLSNAAGSEYLVLGTSDGLADITANSRHCIDSSGTMYLATSNGVYTIDTNDLMFSEVSRKAVINTVSVDGIVYDNPASVVLPADTQRISIEFSALNFSPGVCRVEYQMVGIDKEPIIVDGDKPLVRDYTNIRGGTYVFRVSVIGPNGERSEEFIELLVKKQLAVFEHLYFIVCAVVLAVALLSVIVYLIVQARTGVLLKRQERYHSLTESALRVAAGSIDAKDSYTNGHSTRVAILSREIARRLDWSDEGIENVYYTALVHDIGKIGVPDTLLTKPSKLTEEEYQIIRTHTTMGYKILKDFEGVPDIALGARYHHERYDGTGYCEGLKGEDIPLVARIIAVADAYDAMSSSRVYRPKLAPEKIRQELEDGRGTQFDPEIAGIMLQMIDDGFDPFEEEDN